jgi:protein-tyrosine phosphatase
MTERLDWPGARNLRDGGVTATGRVFRSGTPAYLTDQGWAAARAAGLRTVVDLRNAPVETGRAPDHPTVRPESLAGLAFVAAPTEDPQDGEFLRVCGPWLDHPRSWIDNARLAPDRVAATLRAIGGSEPAVLVHCSGGRDRTGMVSAMLLALAGAGVEAIVDDYADGWRGAGAYPGHGWAYDTGNQVWREREHPATPPGVLETQLAGRLPAVRQWVREFDTGAYLASVGLGAREIDALRALLRP